MTERIRVDGLSKTFADHRGGEVRAVDGVSFGCREGEVFGLLGLTLLFSVSQLPLMTRHRLPEAADDSSEHE